MYDPGVCAQCRFPFAVWSLSVVSFSGLLSLGNVLEKPGMNYTPKRPF